MSGSPARSSRTSRSVRPAAALVVGVALLTALSCTADPGPTPLPACPDRQQVQLEPADAVDFSIARAVSADGGHVVGSRVIGGTSLVLSVRPTTAGAVPSAVGTLAVDSATRPIVGVANGGGTVVFGYVGRSATESDPPSVLNRWSASSGSVVAVHAPVVSSPPVGVAYPSNARAISGDGRRIIWTKAFREGPEPYLWHRIVSVTDSTTDEVLAQWESTGSELSDGNWVSHDGRSALDGDTLVDLDDGARTDLAPVAEAARNAFPGSPFAMRAISDDGRWVVVQRYDPTTAPGLWDTVLWDRGTSHGLRLVPQEPGTFGPVVSGVADDGSVLLVQRTQLNPPRATILGVTATGTSTTIGVSVAPTWPWDSPVFSASSSGDRTVVYTKDLGVGFQLLAERCA